MKFFIKKKKIFKILSKLNTYVGISNKNIILSHILIKLKNNLSVTFTVTDLDIEINCKIKLLDKNIFSCGSFTVNLRKLYELCRTYSEDDLIFFSLYKNRLKLSCLNSISLLNTLPVLQFPVLDKNFSFKYKFSISSLLFKKIISLIYFSMGNQDIYYYLNGMLVEYRNGFFFFVTTDSYRISIYKLPIHYIKCENKKNFSLIISRNLTMELFKFLDFLDNKDVFFEIDINMIKIYFGNFIIYGSLINGLFPDYDDVFSSIKNYYFVDLNIFLFKNALLRSLIISNNVINYVNLSFENNFLILTSSDSNNNEIKEKILIKSIDKNININLNIKFILDILNSIKYSLEIRFYFKDNNSIVKILDVNNEFINYMIMPIQL